jgi:sporulation protein YlmC with PRC-barrel domain
MKKQPKIGIAVATILALGMGAAQVGHAQSASAPQNQPAVANPQPQPQSTGDQKKASGQDTAKKQAPAPGPEQKNVNESANAPKVISVPRVLVNEHMDRAFMDRNVRGSDGRKLGDVKDLLVDSGAGEVPYAVVESGKTLRLVPFKALVPDPEHKRDFTVNATKTEWETFPPLDKDTFKKGSITISDEERRQIAERFTHPKPKPSSSAPAFYTDAISRTLVRSSHLHPKDVRSGSQRLGRIDAILIDPETGKASAFFRPDDRLMTTTASFEVSLTNFSLGGNEREPATTSLRHEDFEPLTAPLSAGKATASASPPSGTAATNKGPAPNQSAAQSPSPAQTPAETNKARASSQAQSTAAQSATSAPSSATSDQAAVVSDQRKATEEKSSSAQAPQQKSSASGNMAANAPPPKESTPAPTGKTSADQTPGGADAKLLQAAQAVRASLDKEAASLARVDVRVNPENGRLVLRGSVADENLKKAIEEKAAQASSGAKIDSQITVETKK